MNKELKDILQRVEQVCKELEEVKKELQKMVLKGKAEGREKRSEDTLPEDQLRQLYEKLRQDFREKGYIAVKKFVEEHRKAFLKQFFRANNLPISVKISKKEISKELIQQLKVGDVISKSVFSQNKRRDKK